MSSHEPEVIVPGHIPPIAMTELDDAQAGKLATIAHHVRGILTALGLDLKDPNLAETDLRVAKMYIEMFHGLSEGAEPKVTTFPNEEGYSHMVMESQIPFYSMCAHHLVPFYGHAHIAYIPRDRILGLSKFARILEFYAKRPQLQERLTEQRRPGAAGDRAQPGRPHQPRPGARLLTVAGGPDLLPRHQGRGGGLSRLEGRPGGAAVHRPVLGPKEPSSPAAGQLASGDL